MFLGFVDLHTSYIIFHLLGVVLGAGGAFMSDVMFFSSIKDGQISATEVSFLKLASRVVWVGVIILIISGLFIFFEDTGKYLSSSKFLAKMTIVGVIVINGIIFHISHIPFLHRHINLQLSLSKEFKDKMSSLMISGVISIVSWLSALVLGAFKSVPYSYLTIMGAYLAILVIGITLSFLFKRYLLPAGYQRVKR